MFEKLTQPIEDAVQPSPRDLLDARVVVLEILNDEKTHHWEALQAVLLGNRGIVATSRPETLIRHRGPDGQLPDPDPDHPALVRERLTAAIWIVLAELVADGVVVQAVGDRSREHTASVSVQTAGYGGSVQFTTRTPTFGADRDGCRWRLLRQANHPRSQLARENLPDGLEDVLGERGIEVLREAVRFFHGGRYMAAADLLAAASEAAWFVLGAACGETDAALARKVQAGEDAAEVIQRTADVIARSKAPPRHTLHDVRAHAARLRDLRNYGLHPVGRPDLDREDAFTEAGCAALFMGARRYFLQLDTARAALLSERAHVDR